MREIFFEDNIEEMRYSGFIYGLKVMERGMNGMPMSSNKTSGFALSGDDTKYDLSSNGAPTNGSNGAIGSGTASSGTQATQYAV